MSCRARRALLGVAVAIGFALAGPAPAAVAAPSLTLEPSSGAPGSTINASGCDWVVTESVLLLWDGEETLASARPDPATGCFQAALTVPADASPGEYFIVAQQADRSASAGFEVTETEEGAFEAERVALFTRIRLYPGEVFPRESLLRARRRASRLSPVFRAHDLVSLGHEPGLTIPLDATAISAWASLGPAPLCSLGPDRCDASGSPFSGRVTAIAAHPDDPNTVFIGSYGGGVWRTTDGGESWTPLFDHMPSLQIGALAIDPFDPQRAYAGTGSTLWETIGYLGLGLYVSEDGGAHWTRVGGKTFDGCSIDRIAMHPDRQDVLVVAATADPASAACEGGVYASLDGGKTWKRWLGRPAVSDVVIAGDRVLAGVHGEGVYASSILQTATGKTLLSASWSKVGGGLPTSDLSRVRIAVAPSNPSRLYVVVGRGTGPLTLKGGWTSGNGGSSWTPINPPNASWRPFLSLAVDPARANRVYLGSTLLSRSLDTGQTFSDPLDTDPHIHVDIPALAFDAAGRLLVGTDGGVYRTSDFEEFENLNSDLSTIMVHPGISGSLGLDGGGPVLAGFQDNGTGKYTGSLTWHEFGFGGDGMYSAVDPRPSQPHKVLYFTAQQGELGKSGDGGSTYDLIGDPSWTQGFWPFVMDLERPDRLYAGSAFLWRSTSGGGSWQKLTSDPAWMTAIAPAPSDQEVVYYGAHHNYATGGAGLYMTKNGGADWTNTTANGLPDRVVTDIVVHSQRAGEAWATVSGFGGGHVFHTDDYGATWDDISGYLPDTPVHAIAIDERRLSPTVFVGTDAGVFITFDGGAHWARTAGGLPNATVTDLMMDRASDMLLAATYGRGVWAAEVQTTHRTVQKQDAQKVKQTLIDYAQALATSPPSGVPGS